jgi:2OG-Fe(II) oxygenase superfamily
MRLEVIPARGAPPRLAALWREEQEAVLLQNAFPRAADVVQRLEQAALPRLRFGRQFEAWSYGRGLDRAGTDLDGFFDGVHPFLKQVEEVLSGIWSPLPWILQQLRLQAGDAPLEIPSENGRMYLPFTIRELPVGGCLPPHAELEQLRRPPYARFREQIEPHTILSWFIMLQHPESGGELAIWSLRYTELGEAQFHRDHTDPTPLLTGRPCTKITPEAGDLLIFDGGRNVHAVQPVGGGRSRWTLGGFVAARRGQPGWWAWA